MNNTFHMVFQNPKDHYNWDKQIEYSIVREGIDDQIRKEWTDSLRFLKELFGKGFLKTISINHPIKSKITNKAPWQIHDLISFVKTLKYLYGSNCNFSKLYSKLLNERDCKREGIPFVEISGCFIREGFQVYFPDEKINKKNYDIEIIKPDSEEKIMIEVSKLEQSKKNSEISDNYSTLFEVLHFSSPPMPFSCLQLKYITSQAMHSVLNDIRVFKKEIFENRSFGFLNNEWIELAISHPSRNEELLDWCKRNGNRETDLRGLSVDFDESKRAVKKIYKKVKQLPSDYPGLIYIPLSPLYFWRVNRSVALDLFEKEINNYPNLYGIVLYSKIGDSADEVEDFDGMHYYGKKKLNEVVSRDLLFVYNRNFELPLSTLTKEAICNSFR